MEHQNKFPAQLSGGQQQRCAYCRALINVSLLLCDEPTGALDSQTSRDILMLLEDIQRQYGTTMLIVTHNNSIKKYGASGHHDQGMVRSAELPE